MANPRKFSEKIALHTQKQAEETAAFEQILREVQTVTTAPQPAPPRDQQPASTRQPQPHLLNAINNPIFRGGSLPNVNQIPQRGGAHQGRHYSPLSTSPRASLNKLGPIRGGQKARNEHAPYASPPSLTQLNTAALSGATSPTLCPTGSYGSPYLMPPMESPWRRANSDSAIHSINSLMIPSVVPDSSEESSNNSNDPRDNYVLSSSPVGGGGVQKPHDGGGVIPTTVGDGPSLLEIPTPVSTGSLPDLTNFQFTTSVQQQVELEDPHNNTSPYSTSPLSVTYSHSPTSCSPHSQQQPTVTGQMPQQGQQQVVSQQQQQQQHGLTQQQRQQQQNQQQHQPPRSPISPHQQHQHPSQQQQSPHQQQQHPSQQQQHPSQQQQHPSQQQQHPSQQQQHPSQQQQHPSQQQQQHPSQQQQQHPSQQQQQHPSQQQQHQQQNQQQHSPQQQQQHHPNSPNALLDNPLSVNTSFQQNFTPNENMLSAYRCPPRPSPQNSPSPFRSPSPHDGQLSAPPSPSAQPQSADSFYLSQQANALQQHFEQISMVDGTPQRNNNGHWQQGGGMANSGFYVYNNGQQQQIGATAGVTTQQSPSHHQPQTPQTPSSIPDIIFTEFLGSDCTDPLEDFLTSEAAAQAFREGLGPIDTGDFQMLADPNLVLPDPQAEDAFRLDRL